MEQLKYTLLKYVEKLPEISTLWGNAMHFYISNSGVHKRVKIVVRSKNRRAFGEYTTINIDKIFIYYINVELEII